MYIVHDVLKSGTWFLGPPKNLYPLSRHIQITGNFFSILGVQAHNVVSNAGIEEVVEVRPPLVSCKSKTLRWNPVIRLVSLTMKASLIATILATSAVFSAQSQPLQGTDHSTLYRLFHAPGQDLFVRGYVGHEDNQQNVSLQSTEKDITKYKVTIFALK